MKVRFYPDTFESDIIEVPDDITDDELNDMACEWVADSIPGFWEVLDRKEEHDECSECSGISKYKSDFCPHCGSDNRGGQEK